jgi:hypothetical protein
MEDSTYQILKEKLELALAIMSDKQVEQYQRGVKLLEKGVKIEDMPETLFTD